MPAHRDAPGEMLAAAPDRLVPGDPPYRESDRENLTGWGFADSAFAILPNGSVTFTGTRYPLAGPELPLSM